MYVVTNYIAKCMCTVCWCVRAPILLAIYRLRSNAHNILQQLMGAHRTHTHNISQVKPQAVQDEDYNRYKLVVNTADDLPRTAT